jgi:mono/diheme cytochrome c family protein
MLRIIVVSILALAVVVVAVAGFRGQTSTRPPLRAFDDMWDQAKYFPQGESAFFADGRAMRPPPAGTVAWGRDAREADGRFLVRDEEMFALTELPVRVDRALLMRGQHQFSIFCAPCHSAAGHGEGMMAEYGMIARSLHDERLRAMPAGEMYQVITQGRGLMGPYGERIKPEDRWAVVAYVRALQRAFHATLEDVPEARRGELE